MKEFRLKKESGAIIPCVQDIPDDARAVVIMVHGFTSNKLCATAEVMYRRMPEAGIGVVTYDQPGHGPDEAKDDELRIANCIDSLRTVEEYVHENYPDKEIFYFSSSFGAYITGLYISEQEHRGTRAFFRSAAVIMPQLILGKDLKITDPEMIRQLEETGYVIADLGLGSSMKLPKGFADDLVLNDLFSKFDRDRYGHTEVKMIHGELDPVVPMKYAKMFADMQHIDFIVMEGEGHSICTNAESPDIVMDHAIEFFKNS